MVGKSKNKGVRNKFRQVLLIEGHPDLLYSERTITYVIIEIDGKSYNIGSVSQDLYEHLEQIPGAEIKICKKKTVRTVGIDGFRGLHIRKAGNNTTIEVSAPTEHELSSKILNIKTYLNDNGVDVSERCSWVCTTDKAKSGENKNVPVKKSMTDELLEKEKVKKKRIPKSSDKLKKARELKKMVIKMGIT